MMVLAYILGFVTGTATTVFAVRKAIDIERSQKPFEHAVILAKPEQIEQWRSGEPLWTPEQVNEIMAVQRHEHLN